jgi:N-acetylneuraminic acid mutarotase
MGRNSDGSQTTSEIVDLTVKGGNMCNNWPDFPISMRYATGGLVGDTVIICGGHECYSLTSEKATLVTHMSVWRKYAASIVFNDNTLWVTGGYGGGGGAGTVAVYFASTEYVTVTGTMPGPDLPMDLYKHAMVAINSTFSMVIGGYRYIDRNIQGAPYVFERFSEAVLRS